MIDEEYIKLFDQCRNLVPVFSIEGREEKTDLRRGDGVYQRLISAMEQIFMALQEENLLSGEHAGGCVLFEQRSEVENLLGR